MIIRPRFTGVFHQKAKWLSRNGWKMRIEKQTGFVEFFKRLGLDLNGDPCMVVMKEAEIELGTLGDLIGEARTRVHEGDRVRLGKPEPEVIIKGVELR